MRVNEKTRQKNYKFVAILKQFISWKIKSIYTLKWNVDSFRDGIACTLSAVIEEFLNIHITCRAEVNIAEHFFGISRTKWNREIDAIHTECYWLICCNG